MTAYTLVFVSSLVVLFGLWAFLFFMIGREIGYLKGWADARPRKKEKPFRGPDEWFAGQDPDPEPDVVVDPAEEQIRRQDYWKHGGKPPDWDPTYE